MSQNTKNNCCTFSSTNDWRNWNLLSKQVVWCENISFRACPPLTEMSIQDTDMLIVFVCWIERRSWNSFGWWASWYYIGEVQHSIFLTHTVIHFKFHNYYLFGVYYFTNFIDLNIFLCYNMKHFLMHYTFINIFSSFIL